MIIKILYIHYQRFERDGSYVHTREFETAFRSLCEAKGTGFTVVSPPLVSTVPRSPGLLGRLRRRFGRYYLREIKTLLVQLWRAMKERRMLARERPDIVLTRFNGESLSILWACRWLDIPSVIEINAPDRVELLKQYRLLPGLTSLFTNHHALKLADGAFAVSDQLARPLRQQDRTGKPIMTVPNGVDIERFSPDCSGTEVRRKYGIAEDRIVIGFVGSFAPWHGLDMLVSAFSEVLRRNPETHLLLVGQTSAEWQALLDRIRDPELSPHIAVSGFVPSEQIPSHLAAMDIAVLPNSAYYCSPLKLFEYMAMAKPTVAVATAPVAAMLKDGEEGLLFPQGDEHELADALLRLAGDRSLRMKLGTAARRKVEQEYTWRHNAERVYMLLEKAYERAQTRRQSAQPRIVRPS